MEIVEVAMAIGHFVVGPNSRSIEAVDQGLKSSRTKTSSPMLNWSVSRNKFFWLIMFITHSMRHDGSIDNRMLILIRT